MTHADYATIANDLRYVFQRKMNASPDRVFNAWTDPAKISKWWDPSGRPLARCEIDLHIGGAFRFVHQNDEHEFRGVYTGIDRPTLLGFDAMGAKGLVKIAPDGHGSVMDVSFTCQTQQQFEHFAKMGIADGTVRTLANLTALLDREG